MQSAAPCHDFSRQPTALGHTQAGQQRQQGAGYVSDPGAQHAGVLHIAVAEFKHLSTIRQFVEENARALGAGDECVSDLIQVTDEAATNVMMYGYAGMPGPLEFEATREGDHIAITMRDRAPAFDPTTLAPPDLSTPLHERRTGGLGVYLMRVLTNNLVYNARPEGGNELVMYKHC